MPLRVWFYVAMAGQGFICIPASCNVLVPSVAQGGERGLSLLSLPTVLPQFNIAYHINLGGRSLHRQVIRTLRTHVGSSVCARMQLEERVQIPGPVPSQVQAVTLRPVRHPSRAWRFLRRV